MDFGGAYFLCFFKALARHAKNHLPDLPGSGDFCMSFFGSGLGKMYKFVHFVLGKMSKIGQNIVGKCNSDKKMDKGAKKCLIQQ